MNILYGIQATGNGHVSRSREVIKNLKELGHRVRVVLSGRNPDRFRHAPIFDPCDIFQGLTFSTSRGKLQLFKTAAGLRLCRFFRDIASFDATDFDLVISDFEPLTSRIAERFGITSIGIGHQYAFLYDIPVSGANPLSRWVLRSFAPVDIPVGLHWHHFNQPILPPIIPTGLANGVRSITEKILVYLPFEHPEDVKTLLASFPAMEFFIYGIPGLDQPDDRRNLLMRPYSRDGFLTDLRDCNGVISNAGFELTSEALQLGKKILVKPLTGQFEQDSNAMAVIQLKLGTAMAELCPRTVAAWLQHPPVPVAGYPDVAGLLAKWLDQGDWRDIEALSSAAWKQTQNIPTWQNERPGVESSVMHSLDRPPPGPSPLRRRS